MLKAPVCAVYGNENATLDGGMEVGKGGTMREREGDHTVRAEEIAGLDRVLDDLESDGQDVIITRSGRPAAIVLDLERYREVQEALSEFADPEYLARLLEARREIRVGDGIAANQVFHERGL